MCAGLFVNLCIGGGIVIRSSEEDGSSLTVEEVEGVLSVEGEEEVVAAVVAVEEEEEEEEVVAAVVAVEEEAVVVVEEEEEGTVLVMAKSPVRRRRRLLQAFIARTCFLLLFGIFKNFGKNFGKKNFGKKNHSPGNLFTTAKATKMRRARSFYTLFRKTGLKPVLTGSMTDLQVKGGEFCRVLEGGGGGYPPLLIGLATGSQVFASWLTRADLDSLFTGVHHLAYTC